MSDDHKSNFDRLWEKYHPPTQPRGPVPRPAAPGSAPAYGQKALTEELANVEGAPEGERNDALNKAAFNLAQLVASGHLPYGSTWDALEAMGLWVGLTPTETRNTLHSAFGAGERQPRDVPERDSIPEASTFEPPGGGGGEERATDVPGPTVRERFPEVDWTDLWDKDDEEEWVLYPLLPARRLVALFSPPKIGKSLLMLELAVAISRGEEVIGQTPDRAHDVLYVDFENDPRGDVIARLKSMGREAKELDRLHYLSFPRLAYLDTAAGAADLLAAVAEYGADVVVIDTISRIVGGEENDNDTWLSFYRHTGLALKQAEVTCIRLDHTGKDQSKGMRGGSAKYGDVDVVWAMTLRSEGVVILECTANRLLIHDKLLILRRLYKPDLRHHPVEGGQRAVIDAEVQAAIDALEEAGLLPEAGRPRWDQAGLLRHKGGPTIGTFGYRTLADAQDLRRSGVTVLGPPPVPLWDSIRNQDNDE